MQSTSLYFLVFIGAFVNAAPKVGPFDLSIVHLNDFHARFEETNNAGGACKDTNCIGGFSRAYAAITAAKTSNPDAILLNVGDNYQGTLYYTLFKWNITQYFMNMIPFDAMVLGNHEFDDGVAGIVPFLQTTNTPIVTANIDDTNEPTFQGLYNKSIVIERNGQKIGIIGVITKSTATIAQPGNLLFLDEAISAVAEAERLVTEEGVSTNIILSHCGYEADKYIATQVTVASKVGVIVGGHSHTFLYTGVNPPGPDTVQGEYPTIVNRTADNKPILIVQASALCKYVGNITISFDLNGDVSGWDGAPIFLDTNLPQDVNINDELAPWKEIVDAVGNKVLGETLVTLDFSTCYYEECLIGNFVTDVMVFNYTTIAEPNSWTYASLAITNAGGLRASIEKGDITYNDLVTAQPFANTFDVGEIEGRYIKDLLENCVAYAYDYGRAYSDIKLLQVSGIHVVFDLNQMVGSRVTSLKLRCNSCTVPVYEDLDLNKMYRLIIPSFLTTGGDGFSIIQDNMKNITTGKVDIDVFTDYLATKSPVYQEIEGRIQIIGGERIKTRNLPTFI